MAIWSVPRGPAPTCERGAYGFVHSTLRQVTTADEY
jgi:hypothetical protein